MSPRGVRIATGALLGLTWGAGFRAYMSELAGGASTFNWVGTFGAILVPSALSGAALGLAEDLRRNGGAPNWRWLAAAPVTLAVAPLLLPGAVPVLVTTGMGSGAAWVVLTGVLGGYGLSGHGPRVGRAIARAIAAASTAGLIATVPAFGGEALALTGPRGAWIATLAFTFTITLALGCSIPFRAVSSRRSVTQDRR